MMKCPNCKKEVNQYDRYCPRCGYRIIGQKRKRPKRQIILLALALLCFMSPILNYILYQRVLNTSDDSYTLEEVINRDAREQIYAFASVDEFKKNITNANQFLAPITDYQESLEKQYNTKLTVNYEFEIYDNNDLQVEIEFEGKLSQNRSIYIRRSYDRLKTYDDIIVKIKKENCKNFNQLKMTESKQYMIQLIGEKQYQQLMASFNKKESDFNTKKITHYGIGSYTTKGALIITKNNDYYIATFKTKSIGKNELVK